SGFADDEGLHVRSLGAAREYTGRLSDAHLAQRAALLSNISRVAAGAEFDLSRGTEKLTRPADDGALRDAAGKAPGTVAVRALRAP
ncbi:hypothetical protein, partial [Escherichia coli]|uniref:hypothetical protein n=1 Tax=Escherichia coli TaxID=562 RepID=UPI0028DF21CC